MYLEETEILKEYKPKAFAGFKCPNCKAVADRPKVRSEAEFIEAPDPYMKWVEGHKCTCGTKYHLYNGT